MFPTCAGLSSSRPYYFSLETYFSVRRLIDQLTEVLKEPPEWDIERKYNIGSINVYFEGKSKQVHTVNVQLTLGEILQDKR